MKLIYKILITAIFFGIIAALIWVFWPRIDEPEIPNTDSFPTSTFPDYIKPSDSKDDGDQNQNDSATSTEATTVSANFRKLSDVAALDFWVYKNSNSVFYISENGAVFEAKEGKDEEVPVEKIGALNRIEADKRGEKTLVSVGDPNSPKWVIFDSADKTWRPLPLEIVNATWAGESKLIATVRDGSSLNLSEVDLTKTPPVYKTIFKDFRMKNVTFKFVKEDKLIVAEKPSSIAQSRVWLLNTKTLNFNLLFSSGKGDWTYFDKNSDYIFKSNGDGLVLIISPAFETDRGLDFSTFAGKCSFDNASTTYCFVPQVNTFGESGILLNNYLTRKNKTIDELYSFNLWNGEISIPFSGPLANSLIVDAEKLLINKKNLFFINRYDRGVYKIIIPEKSQEKE